MMRALASMVVVVLVGACTPPGESGIPGPAVLATEGGASVSFTATENGTVYVRDQPADRVVYEGAMTAGQRLEVDGKGNRLSVDGREVKGSGALRADATYQVYFKPGAKREYHPMMTP